MKTRDRILLTALTLFNEEGEQNVTTVDIANEMDISPGNLYYHFKGKESIIESLYAQFDADFSQLLQQSEIAEMSLENHWYFMYVIFEEIHKYRFFYLNQTDILQRYQDIGRRFKRLVKQKVKTIELLCKSLIEANALSDSLVGSQQLAENISFTLLYWFPYQQLINPSADYDKIIHAGVYQILSLIVPYAQLEDHSIAQSLLSIYHARI
ncbi:MAG: TetR/AcrR family transcriptional regulator [Cellvibrionales bacterium]|nr:TetR/AcrR family transcriptional regulator [Cellvibrionales bacterium]